MKICIIRELKKLLQSPLNSTILACWYSVPAHFLCTSILFQAQQFYVSLDTLKVCIHRSATPAEEEWGAPRHYESGGSGWQTHVWNLKFPTPGLLLGERSLPLLKCTHLWEIAQICAHCTLFLLCGSVQSPQTKVLSTPVSPGPGLVSRAR